MLSFGGLLSEVISGGSPGLTQSNPGIVKILGGFVFPVGLVMCIFAVVRVRLLKRFAHRIVLQGHELLTSNMMVRLVDAGCVLRWSHFFSFWGGGSGISDGGLEACCSMVVSSAQLPHWYFISPHPWEQSYD